MASTDKLEAKANVDGKQQLLSRPNSASILSPVSKQVKLFQLRHNKVSDFSEPIPVQGTRPKSRKSAIGSCGGKIDPTAIATVLTSKEYIGPDILIILGSLMLLIGLGVVLLGIYAPSGIEELQSMVFAIGPSMMGIGLLFTCLRLLFWRPRLCVWCKRFDKKKEENAKKSATSLKPPVENGVAIRPRVGRPRTSIAGRVPNPMLNSARLRMEQRVQQEGQATVHATKSHPQRPDESQLQGTKCNCNSSSPCEKCRRKMREIAQEAMAKDHQGLFTGASNNGQAGNLETAVLIEDKGMPGPFTGNANDDKDNENNGDGEELKNGDNDTDFDSPCDDEEKDNGSEKKLERTVSQEFDEAFKETMKDLGGSAA